MQGSGRWGPGTGVGEICGEANRDAEAEHRGGQQGRGAQWKRTQEIMQVGSREGAKWAVRWANQSRGLWLRGLRGGNGEKGFSVCRVWPARHGRPREHHLWPLQPGGRGRAAKQHMGRGPFVRVLGEAYRGAHAHASRCAVLAGGFLWGGMGQESSAEQEKVLGVQGEVEWARERREGGSVKALRGGARASHRQRDSIAGRTEPHTYIHTTRERVGGERR